MGGKVSTATQGNAPRQNTAYKQKTKRAAPSNPSGSERTKKSSGVNFIIAKKKKAKSNQLPKYRSQVMSFTNQLSVLDLSRLRKIVANVQLKHYPTGYLTPYEIDKFIDAMGPEVAGNLIKHYTDAGKV